MPRGRQIAYYGIPLLFCLAVHQFALKTWFFQDDFAWLALRLDISSPHDLLEALFVPKAQGTVRTLSERLYFLVFSSLFGLNVIPFRAWAFLTQFASIVLLIQITRRLTGSAAAGFLAAILWAANVGLAFALAWSSAYNEIAFAFVVLLAFRLYLLYIDTGRRKFWIWHWIVFLLGFGVLESAVVYPAIAAGYALCCARTHFRKTLLLFIPSIVFLVLHFTLIPPPTDPHYKMHFGAGPLVMLWTYWSYAIGALRDSRTDWRPLWLGLATTIAITASLLFFTVKKLRVRDGRPAFAIAWFLIVIAPVLPLREHFTEYYVAVPAIGLAILGAWAVSSARGITAVLAAMLAGLYLTVSIAETHLTEKFFYERARRMKYLVLGLQALPKSETSKTILIDGVDNDMFWSGMADDPFRLLDISRIYVTPGSETSIDPHLEWGGISRWLISLDNAVTLIRNHEAVVFELKGRNLRDVTGHYLSAVEFASNHPGYVAVGDPMYQARLGPTWYQAEQGFRWMPKSATLKIGGPRNARQMLEITGFCPATLLMKGPVQVSFRADGMPIGSATLKQPDQHFTLSYALPAGIEGRKSIEIEIEVNRTTTVPGDSRTFGLVFGTFTIK